MLGRERRLSLPSPHRARRGAMEKGQGDVARASLARSGGRDACDGVRPKQMEGMERGVSKLSLKRGVACPQSSHRFSRARAEREALRCTCFPHTPSTGTHTMMAALSEPKPPMQLRERHPLFARPTQKKTALAVEHARRRRSAELHPLSGPSPGRAASDWLSLWYIKSGRKPLPSICRTRFPGAPRRIPPALSPSQPLLSLIQPNSALRPAVKFARRKHTPLSLMVDDAAVADSHLASPEAGVSSPQPPASSWWSKASPARPPPAAAPVAAAAAPSPSSWRPWGAAAAAAPSPTPSGRQAWGGEGGGDGLTAPPPWSAAASPRRPARRPGGAGPPPRPPRQAAAPPAFDPASDLASHVATVLASIGATVRTARAAALLAGAALGGTTCLAGWVLLASLLAARSLAPPSAVVTRDLWVDYTASPATGVASFLPDPAAAALVAAAAQEKKEGAATTLAALMPRAFPAGRRLDVWLAMDAPDVDVRGGGGGAAGDVFQVRAELLAPDGRVLAAASRPALLPPRSRAARALRSAALVPLVVLGLADELRTLRVPLFAGYRDRADAPFVALRIALAGRAPAGSLPAAGPGPPPALAAVRGIVSHRLGLARRLLYYVRPGDALAWPLFALAAAAIAGGGAAAALCGLGWALTAGRGGGRGRGGNDDDAPRPPWEAPSAAPSGAATPSIAGTEDGGEDESWDGDDGGGGGGGEWAAGREPSVITSFSSDGDEDAGDAAASISSSSGEEEYTDSVPGSPAVGRWVAPGGAGLRWRGGG